MNIAARIPTAPTVASFEALDREACLKRWRKQFDHEPPRYVSVEFMRKVFAYEAQVAAFGGHSKAVRNILKAHLKETERGAKPKAGAKAVPSPATLRAGTHLVREWNGRIYQVEVTADGFQMDGKHFGSLSAIARKITGTPWSGPRFFGLART
ncbi:DUF2924 domain-containing protein [Rhizobium deserti]|uniref:DUF2924 domain-containing protein n=1 Tax=Rhizobium deserti TaxID=2547961 RepID=UPI001FE0AC27|nr:DUF2924 domain-containing protein [Rhizobium deserti]